MVGVDEVGRGCWAGPMLVVAARQTGDLPAGLKDSKSLSITQRHKLFDLLGICCDFGEGWVSAVEIDQLGLTKSQQLGVARSLDALGTRQDEQIIIDGKFNYAPKSYTKSEALIKADNSVPIVSAASIYAKVVRDRFMTELAKRHPDYSFDKHVGYGTKLHVDALSSFGVINQVHRLSYAPIAKFAGAGA